MLGGKTLLSDPQILADSSLGFIFADGNIPHGHTSLEEHHVCNHFCNWFGVPSGFNFDSKESSSKELWSSKSRATFADEDLDVTGTDMDISVTGVNRGTL